MYYYYYYYYTTYIILQNTILNNAFACVRACVCGLPVYTQYYICKYLYIIIYQVYVISVYVDFCTYYNIYTHTYARNAVRIGQNVVPIIYVCAVCIYVWVKNTAYNNIIYRYIPVRNKRCFFYCDRAPACVMNQSGHVILYIYKCPSPWFGLLSLSICLDIYIRVHIKKQCNYMHAGTRVYINIINVALS